MSLWAAQPRPRYGRRLYNPDGWDDYMKQVQHPVPHFEDDGARDERMFERMMMGLRMVRGMDAARFERDFGQAPETVWPKTIKRMTDGGLLERAGDRLRLTPHGMQVMNGVLVEMLEESDASPM